MTSASSLSSLWYYIACVAVMAIVTYLPRMIPLAFFKHKIKNRFLRSFLAYLPYGVIAAMILPDVFSSTGSVISASVGLLTALVLAFFKKSLLTTAVGAIVAVFICEYILNLL